MDTSDSTTLKRVCNTCGYPFPLISEYWHRDKRARNGFAYSCKACARQRASNWLEENREQNKEKCRTRYATMRDTYTAYNHEHAPQIAKRKREWRKNNPDKVRKHKLDSQRRNRASANARSKRFRQRHRDKVRTWTRIQQHRRRHAPGKFTRQDIELQYRSQKGLCWWCGMSLSDDFHIDHRVPLARGGTNAPENLCISCPDCNRSKGAKLPHEWNGRLL